MVISLINGNPENGNSQFEAYIKELSSELKLQGNTVSSIQLRDNNIQSCTGCWGCWVKTPGECLFKDDSIAIRKKVIESDWVIFLSPLIMGFTSALLKKMQDKFIPLVHPYVELVNNECHHEKRYEDYPKLGLVYAREPQTDEEDLQIVSDIYKRFAINFKSELKVFRSIDEPIKKLIHEISIY